MQRSFFSFHFFGIDIIFIKAAQNFGTEYRQYILGTFDIVILHRINKRFLKVEKLSPTKERSHALAILRR